MQLVAPEIVAEAKGLSVGLLGVAIALGGLLWILGWWGHRFWIVLVSTVSAGILGLLSGPTYGVQPLVAGLLLAVSAGVLALALVRLVAYVAGGIAAWMIVHSLAPLWDQPVLCFLVGGLIGLLLFRVWTMALTSFMGTLLLVYGGLSLADRLGQLDATAWSGQNPELLNWLCIGMGLLGLVVQFLLERYRGRRERDMDEDSHDRPEWAHRQQPRSWWGWGQTPYRRAG